MFSAEPFASKRLFPELALFETKEERDKAFKVARKQVSKKLALLGFATSVVVMAVIAVVPMVGFDCLKRLGILSPEAMFPHNNYPPFAAPLGLALCGFWLTWLYRYSIRRSLREQLAKSGVPICVECGYQLRGLTEPRCPECGTPSDAIAPDPRPGKTESPSPPSASERPEDRP
ncbi:MAG: hypothetical protein JXQ73_32590 [Phycisphaerae bacterium]|nr:hypothetical protein [Phycisphaerae bacterium]